MSDFSESYKFGDKFLMNSDEFLLHIPVPTHVLCIKKTDYRSLIFLFSLIFWSCNMFPKSPGDKIVRHLLRVPACQKFSILKTECN